MVFFFFFFFFFFFLSAYAKSKTQISFAVTAKLISAFVFATRIVQFLFYLNPKFQASSSFLCLYRPVCVGPVRKPHCWFSHEAAQIHASLCLSSVPRLSVAIYTRDVYILVWVQTGNKIYIICTMLVFCKKKSTS